MARLRPTPDSLSFRSQRLAFSDEAAFADEVQAIKTKHRIQASELKSSLRGNRSAFVHDIVRMVCTQSTPFFIEIVDKRFFLAAHVVNLLLLPPIPGLFADARTHYVQNALADYLAERSPEALFSKFIEACLLPSSATLERVFEELIQSARADQVEFDVACVARDLAETARRDFDESLNDGDERAHLRYLPSPDLNKHDKEVWLLPNLSSFTNIYARINLYRRGRVADVHLIHDEQLQFESILEQAKRSAESLGDRSAMFKTPHSDFQFRESASLIFASSKDSTGLQVADLVAGFCMRYVKAFFADIETVSTIDHRTFDLLRRSTDPIRGSGINQVITSGQARALSLIRF